MQTAVLNMCVDQSGVRVCQMRLAFMDELRDKRQRHISMVGTILQQMMSALVVCECENAFYYKSF